MVERGTTYAVPVEAARRALKLSVASLLAAATMVVAAPGEADASYTGGWVDSDGYVPVYSTCYAGYEVGSYSWYSDGYTVSGTIYVNDCALQSLGAGPNDRARVIAHEQGHAAGLPHSYDPNDIMYPVTSMTGT